MHVRLGVIKDLCSLSWGDPIFDINVFIISIVYSCEIIYNFTGTNIAGLHACCILLESVEKLSYRAFEIFIAVDGH